MQRILVLAATAFCAVASAQPIRPCAGTVADYRDTSCAVPPGTVDAAPFEFEPVTPVDPFRDMPDDAMGDWDTREPIERRLWAQREEIALAARVLERQRPANERQAAQYAENRGRCEEATRVAHLCGKNAGTFYCDEKGFQPIAVAARTAAPELDNEARFAMQHCVREVAKSKR